MASLPLPPVLSAEKLLERFKDWSRGRVPLVGIDFDGTLVPLHPDPRQVRLSPHALSDLNEIARRHQLAFISGRALGDLRRHLPVADASFVGNHGAEVLSAKGLLWEWHDEHWTRWRENSLQTLSELVLCHGGWIEDKIFSLTIHFRGSGQEQWWETQGQEALRKLVGGVLRVLDGKMCWNLSPHRAPHKGDALLRLCQELNLKSALYFGDEPTDENVFRLQQIPLFSVKVGPEPTAANHRVESHLEVLRFLERFACH